VTAKLKGVNERIWQVRNAISECERRAEFGPDFVALARGIHRSNDERAALKRRLSFEFEFALMATQPCAL
jgi:hypothetical protein